MAPPIDRPIDGFCDALLATGRRRFSFVRSADAQRLTASDPALEPLAHAIAGLADFAAHEAIFLEVGVKTGALLSAFVHQTVRGQAAGGVRHWPYATLGDFLRDGLRLARGMGRKNALAGIWWGGGKGVIARQGERALDQEYRRELYEEYGRFISSLGGCYVTAEDAGTTPTDMAAVFRTTRFVTCVPPQTGGSGNPSPATAKGVVCAMEAALDHLGAGSLAGKRVAMQGAGSVGAAMIADLLERNVASVVVTDMNHEQCAAVRGHFATAPVTVRWVPAGDASVFGEECDVLAPNALGGCLNPDTIARLRCRVVCGAANNQLEDEVADGRALHARHILYVPDFVANRMGIVSCANEQYGSLPADPSILRHFGRTWENAVYVITRKILEQATREGIPPGEAANAIADRLALEPHPIFPHRGWTIARALAEERWHEGQSSG